VLSGEIALLPCLEHTALTLRIRDDLKQSEIATVMGCSQMQVSRLLRAAIEKIRTVSGDPDPSTAREA